MNEQNIEGSVVTAENEANAVQNTTQEEQQIAKHSTELPNNSDNTDFNHTNGKSGQGRENNHSADEAHAASVSDETSADETSADETSQTPPADQNEQADQTVAETKTSDQTEAATSTDEAVSAEAEAAPTEAADEAVTATEESSDEEDDEEKINPDIDTIVDLKKGQHLSGMVKNITDFGVFVDLGIPQDGLVHISQMARRKIEKPTDIVKEGDQVDVWVKKVDKKRGRISLTMIRPIKLRLKDINADDQLEGTVTRLESYGAFVDIQSERDGLVHISEITHEYIKHPEEALAVGAKVKIKVLKVDYKKRQVDLSVKALLPPPEPKEEPKHVDEVRTIDHERFERRTRQGSRSSREEILENKQPEPQPLSQEELDEPMVTAMAAAFSAFQDVDPGGAKVKGRRRKKKRRSRNSELDEVIAQTLDG